MKTVYFGGGCFWCTEAVFRSLRGVHGVVPGYMGGTVPHPTYEQISSGTTGHAEVVKVRYDDAVISTDDLLEIFFVTHDPTTPDRQGNDVGTQYRSVIFYDVDESDGEGIDDMRSVIERARIRAQVDHAQPIVTQVAPAAAFYPAEEYHQQYYALHASAPYCQLVINPKLDKLQEHYADKLVA